MVYFHDPQTWLQQSTLLLSARPTSTRITTKYTLLPQPPTPAATSTTSAPPSSSTPAARAHLILKTYDPQSGTCLKYKTDRAAEVGRLVGALGRCGRVMAAVPLEKEREEQEGMGGGEEGDKMKEGEKGVEKVADAKAGAAAGGARAEGGKAKGGGGGKKKKGKK